MAVGIARGMACRRPRRPTPNLEFVRRLWSFHLLIIIPTSFLPHLPMSHTGCTCRGRSMASIAMLSQVAGKRARRRRFHGADMPPATRWQRGVRGRCWHSRAKVQLLPESHARFTLRRVCTYCERTLSAAEGPMGRVLSVVAAGVVASGAAIGKFRGQNDAVLVRARIPLPAPWPRPHACFRLIDVHADRGSCTVVAVINNTKEASQALNGMLSLSHLPAWLSAPPSTDGKRPHTTGLLFRPSNTVTGNMHNTHCTDLRKRRHLRFPGLAALFRTDREFKSRPGRQSSVNVVRLVPYASMFAAYIITHDAFGMTCMVPSEDHFRNLVRAHNATLAGLFWQPNRTSLLLNATSALQ